MTAKQEELLALLDKGIAQAREFKVTLEKFATLATAFDSQISPEDKKVFVAEHGHKFAEFNNLLEEFQ